MVDIRQKYTIKETKKKKRTDSEPSDTLKSKKPPGTKNEDGKKLTLKKNRKKSNVEKFKALLGQTFMNRKKPTNGMPLKENSSNSRVPFETGPELDKNTNTYSVLTFQNHRRELRKSKSLHGAKRTEPIIKRNFRTLKNSESEKLINEESGPPKVSLGTFATDRLHNCTVKRQKTISKLRTYINQSDTHIPKNNFDIINTKMRDQVSSNPSGMKTEDVDSLQNIYVLHSQPTRDEAYTFEKEFTLLCLRNDFENIFKYISNDEKYLNMQDSLYGLSPLHWCVYHDNKLEILKKLIDFGVDIVKKNKMGNSVLHLAIIHERTNFVKFLASNYVDLKSQCNYDYMTPYDIYSKKDIVEKEISDLLSTK